MTFIRTLRFVAAIAFFLTGSKSHGQIAPSTGTPQSATIPTMPQSPPLKVNGTESWSGVVYLDRDVVIDTNAILTITPGTVVLIASEQDKSGQGVYQPLVEIKVLGKLIACGTVDKPIVFFAMKDEWRAKQRHTVMQKEGKYVIDNLTVDPHTPLLREHSLWGGIQFESKSQGTLEHCVCANAVTAVFATSSNPAIINCVFSDCVNGINCGNRVGLRRDSTGKIVRDAKLTMVGGKARPTIEKCFIFRCIVGATFINHCGPSIRDTVFTDCRTGIHYLHTSQTSLPTITNCVIARANIAIENRGQFAVIRNNVLAECKYGLVIWVDKDFMPTPVAEGNTLPPTSLAVAYYHYRDGNRYEPAPKEAFRNNSFELGTFQKANYDDPPSGDWHWHSSL